MKKLRSMAAAKGIAVLLLTASVIGIPYLVWMIGNGIIQCKNVEQISDLCNYQYKEGEEFSNDVAFRITQLTEYLTLKELLETEGQLDYNKTVVTVQNANGNENYSIGDLLKYNENNYHFYPESVMPSSKLSVDVSCMELNRNVYPIRQLDNGEIEAGEKEKAAFLVDFMQEENLVFSSLKEACQYYQTLWETQRKPENTEQRDSSFEERGEIEEFLDSISDKLGKENNKTSVPDTVAGEIHSKEVKVNLLSDAAYCMTYYVAYYQYYQSIFERNQEEEKPDFLYWIGTSDGQVITNVLEKELGTDPKEIFSGINAPMGEIWYETNTYLTKATMQIDRAKISGLENLFLKESNGNVSIHLSIPSTEKNGFFCTRQRALEDLYHSIPQYAGGLLVVGFLALFCIWFLFYSAGHKEGYERIYLNWFDRWYTEPAGMLCMGLGILFVVILCDYLDYHSIFGIPTIDEIGIVFLLGIGCYLIALFSFASLTRRIKARILWKNSLTCRMIHLFRRYFKVVQVAVMRIWQNRSVAKKMILTYIGLLFLNFIVPVLCYLAWGTLKYGFEEEKLIGFFCLCLIFSIGFIDFKVLKQLVEREAEFNEIFIGAERISLGDWNYKLEEQAFHGTMCRMAGAVNRIGDGLSSAIEQSVRDERMKTDLITNVSHDIKTPLTSIINYVDLLKREQFEDEKVRSYLEVLDQKSQRLKNLIDDLIEASKLSSKTVVLSIEKIDLTELVRQTNGEFAEKFAAKNLTIMPTLPEQPVYIEADGKGMWRVLENLYNNVSKYAMENTRVYISVLEEEGKVEFVIKNISASPLNINASELTERFIRGDLSRSTEGSGLGLSIAKSLIEMMRGQFEIYLDGDLFRVTISFGVQEGKRLQEGEKEIVIQEIEN